MFTSGFFNSVNSDRRYNAEQMSAIFDGLISNGIFDTIGDHFQVSPGDGLTVTVGTGRAWLNQTWSYNDSLYPLALSAASPSLSRKDLVCIKVDKSNAVRANSIVLIEGTPASSPVEPTVTDDATNGIYYHKLAAVTVPAGATSISAANIYNYIGLSTGTPYVTGIVSTTAVDELWSQWDGEFNDWWENTIKPVINTETVTQLQNNIDHITPKEATMNLYGFSHINPPPSGKTYQEYSTDAILNQISSLLNDSPFKKYKWTKRSYSVHMTGKSYQWGISSDYYTICYSSTLSGNSLENPTILQIAKSTYNSQTKINNLASALSGKYFIMQGGSSAYPNTPSTTNLSYVYYGLGSGTYKTGDYYSYLNTTRYAMMNFSAGWSSVLSSDSSAYPSNGYVGDDCYIYDGKLENLIQDYAIVCSGTYVGTGTATTWSSPKTITIPHDPKIIFINPVYYSSSSNDFTSAYATYSYAPSRYVGLVFTRTNEFMKYLGFVYMNNGADSYSGKYDPINRKFQWYVDPYSASTESAKAEGALNILNCIYGWIAIC